jgi:hypothetical protein
MAGAAAARQFHALFLDTNVTAYALTYDGEIMRHVASTDEEPETYCAMQHLALTDPVLETLWYPCGNGFNPRILTQQQLIGTGQGCPSE